MDVVQGFSPVASIFSCAALTVPQFSALRLKFHQSLRPAASPAGQFNEVVSVVFVTETGVTTAVEP